MFEVAEPCPAIVLLDRNAMQAERAEFRPEITRELVGLVDVGGAGRDLMTCEILDGIANRVRSFAEIVTKSRGPGL